MPAFDSGTVVEPLAWTFEKHVPGARGVIREPTDEQIAQYLTDVKAMTAKFRDQLPAGTDGDDPAELLAAVDDLDPQVVLTVHQELAGIYAALCSGNPSEEVLLKLPLRIRVLFYQWLQGEVMSPEAVPGGGSAQATTLRSPAAG